MRFIKIYSNLFAKLTKTISYTMDEVYREASKFVNHKRELNLGRKRKSIMEAFLEKEKRRISLNKVVQDKVVTKKTNTLPQLTKEEINGLEILDPRVEHSHLLEFHLCEQAWLMLS